MGPEDQELYQTLMDMGLDEDQIREIMGLGSIAQEQAGIPAQMERAERLYMTPPAQGRWAGRVYNRAHPLEHLSTGARQLAGVVSAYRGNKRAEELRNQATDARAELLRRMRTGGGGYGSMP